MSDASKSNQEYAKQFRKRSLAATRGHIKRRVKLAKEYLRGNEGRK